ncbi:MAG: glutaredoxin family protein [Candidatus Dormiibacterota bacterium]
MGAIAPAWKTGGSPTAEHLQLLSRRNCPLCESARVILLELAAAHRMVVSEYDIDEDPVLRARFTDRVPVILYRDRVLAEGQVDAAELRVALDELVTREGARSDDSVTEAGLQPDRG